MGMSEIELRTKPSANFDAACNWFREQVTVHVAACGARDWVHVAAAADDEIEWRPLPIEGFRDEDGYFCWQTWECAFNGLHHESPWFVGFAITLDYEPEPGGICPYPSDHFVVATMTERMHQRRFMLPLSDDSPSGAKFESWRKMRGEFPVMDAQLEALAEPLIRQIMLWG